MLPMVKIVDLKLKNCQQALGRKWLDEGLRFEYCDDNILAAECAELAEELWLHEMVADEDDNFVNTFGEWIDYIYGHELLLPLEQSCNEGVLLPTDMRLMRLATCPEVLLRPLRWFFEFCPAHIKSYVALYFFTLVRIERARRTGDPFWSPATGKETPPASTFYRPRTLKFRPYSR